MSGWVFGYGSLVWRPSFPYQERRPASVEGWVRRFWQGSPDHRGVPDAPGRVATMLRWPGRRCLGVAYRLSEETLGEVLLHLDHRERAGYERHEVEVDDPSTGERFGRALTWVATASNPNFLGMASPHDMAAQIARARGDSGTNAEYVLKLAEALRGLGADAGDQTFVLEALLQERE